MATVAAARIELDTSVVGRSRSNRFDPAPLERFFTAEENFRAFEQVVGHTGGVTLRMVDHLLTRYSKANRVLIRQADGSRVDVHESYKRQLKGYKKAGFDVFNRQERVLLNRGDVDIVTTFAQLNCFRWCILSGVLAWASENRDRLSSSSPEEALAPLAVAPAPPTAVALVVRW